MYSGTMEMIFDWGITIGIVASALFVSICTGLFIWCILVGKI